MVNLKSFLQHFHQPVKLMSHYSCTCIVKSVSKLSQLFMWSFDSSLAIDGPLLSAVIYKVKEPLSGPQSLVSTIHEFVILLFGNRVYQFPTIAKEFWSYCHLSLLFSSTLRTATTKQIDACVRLATSRARAVSVVHTGINSTCNQQELLYREGSSGVISDFLIESLFHLSFDLGFFKFTSLFLQNFLACTWTKWV